ncbi:hypothetical protein [Thermococcus sp.]
MEWKIVEILYREMTYRRLKANPQLSADWKKFSKMFKRSGSLRRSVLSQSVAFTVFGLILTPALYSVKDPGGALVIYSSYFMIPLLMALYSTAVTSQYAVSLGLFEPLLSLPIDVGGKYLSVLLLVIEVPSVFFLLPPSVVIAVKLGSLAGAIGFAWALLGAFMGHTLGLIIYERFGKTSAGRFSGLKTLFKALAIVIIMSLFYGLNYFQRYVASHYETLKGLVERYSVAYPFSVATVEKPSLSLGLFSLYGLAFVLTYYLTIKRLWAGISEGTISESSKRPSRLFSHRPEVALALKDFKIAARNTSLLTGLLMPVVVVIPSLLGAIGSGFNWSVMPVLLALGWTSAISVDAVLKIDGGAFEVLRTLPLELRTFLRSKMLVMSALPVLAGLSITIGMSFRNFSNLFALPVALLLPLATSGITLSVFYWRIREVALPRTTWRKMGLSLFLNGAVVGVTGVVWFFMKSLSLIFLVAVVGFLLWKLSR